MTTNEKVIEAARELNAVLLPLAQARLDDLGLDGSGFYQYYARRIQSGFLVSEADQRLAAAIIDAGIGRHGIHEIGGGIGTLSWLLARLGHDVVCVESEPGRFNAATELIKAIVDSFPQLKARLKFLKARFPIPHTELAPGRTLALATNIIITATPEIRADIMSGFAQYGSFVIDMDRFVTEGSGDEDRQRLASRFAERGMGSVPFLDLGKAGHFRLFTSDVVELRPPYAADPAFGWHISLPDFMKASGDTMVTPHRSAYMLFENDVPLPHGHQAHANIAKWGMGAYSHWEGSLYFSTSDNTDPTTNGRAYSLRRPSSQGSRSAADMTSRLDILADVLRRREVTSVVYFHTDHFEPWAGRTEEQALRALDHFAQVSARLKFGSKQTLFYTPAIDYHLESAAGGDGVQAQRDMVVFARPAESIVAKARQHVGRLNGEFRHEFQVHVHHERWTKNHLKSDSDVWRWVNAHSTPALDRSRLAKFIDITLEAIREESSSALTSWAFVHGNWALNGSDDEICHVYDEMALLLEKGCFGDFTFPAGRTHCNPERLLSPYTCLPVTGRKSYDSEAAQPIRIARGAGALTPNRFLIWNSKVNAYQVSLDFFQLPGKKLYQDLDRALLNWLEMSPIIDGVLYVKTHSHSLDPKYGGWESDAHTPHSNPDAVALFNRLEAVCERGKIGIEYLTVSEVYSRLLRADSAAPVAENSIARVREVPRPSLKWGVTTGVAPLIFDHLHVEREEIGLRSPFPLPPQSDFHIWPNRAFPVPGNMQPQDVSDVKLTADGLVFPRYGAYNLICPAGVFKVLLVHPDESSDKHIFAISQFVSQCSWHSGCDTSYAVADAISENIRPDRLMEKLFYSDQPLGLRCGHIARLLAFILVGFGFKARITALLTKVTGGGHIFTEAFFPSCSKWVMLDPSYGVIPRLEKEWLSAREVVALRKAGRVREIEFVDVGLKAFPRPANNFDYSFFGGLSWRPDMMKPAFGSGELHRYYVENVVEPMFEDVVSLDPVVTANSESQAATVLLERRIFGAL